MADTTRSDNLYTLLYDTKSGGGARAFQCAMEERNYITELQPRWKKCLRVTRTERGMWLHLRIIHGIIRQPKIFS